MDRSETTMVQAPSNAELERAVASVPGVVEAEVGVSPDTGRGRLRLRLAPDADPEAVSWAVAATLHERFDIDLASGRIHSGPATAPDIALDPEPDHDPVRVISAAAAPGETGHTEPLSVARDRLTAAAHAALAGLGRDDPATTDRCRAMIRDLVSRRDRDEVEVVACLALREAEAYGHATGAMNRHGLLMAVARATVGAVRTLTGEQLAADVADVVHVADADPPTAQVVVVRGTARGDETLIGIAIVRGDLEHAVMRATLDALNRRIEPLLEEDPVA